MGKKHLVSNIEWWRADQERRRSSVAEPHRNKARYDRKDYRRQRQRGSDDE